MALQKDFLIGGGKYKLQHLLKRGGQAEVWVAEQQGIAGFSKEIVLKIVTPDPDLKNQPMQKMLLDEARLAARLHHPNIVEIYDVGIQGDLVYIAMEWIRGHDLEELLEQSLKFDNRPIPWPYACYSIIEACKGLHNAHSSKHQDGTPMHLVHRDLKPSNVLISREGYTKVIDFGIAKVGNISKTQTGYIKGTPAYMSPEQIRSEPLDRRTDLFSIGAILYEICSGQIPFQGTDLFSMLYAIASTDPEPFSHRIPGFPKELEDIILKLLSKDREHRFATARDLQRALERLLHKHDQYIDQETLAEFFEHLDTNEKKGTLPSNGFSRQALGLSDRDVDNFRSDIGINTGSISTPDYDPAYDDAETFVPETPSAMLGGHEPPKSRHTLEQSDHFNLREATPHHNYTKNIRSGGSSLRSTSERNQYDSERQDIPTGDFTGNQDIDQRSPTPYPPENSQSARNPLWRPEPQKIRSGLKAPLARPEANGKKQSLLIVVVTLLLSISVGLGAWIYMNPKRNNVAGPGDAGSLPPTSNKQNSLLKMLNEEAPPIIPDQAKEEPEKVAEVPPPPEKAVPTPIKRPMERRMIIRIRKAPLSRYGYIKFRISPRCSLYERGRSLGKAGSLKVRKRPGRYSFVCVNKSRRLIKTIRVRVRRGQTTRVTKRYRMGRLFAISYPWSDIYVSGLGKIGQTQSPISLPAGRYTLRFYKQGKPPIRKMRVTIRAGRTTRTSVLRW